MDPISSSVSKIPEPTAGELEANASLLEAPPRLESRASDGPPAAPPPAVKALVDKHTAPLGLPKKDWCGSTGSEWVPEGVGKVDWSAACKTHDECYGTPEVLLHKANYQWWNPVVYNSVTGRWYFNTGTPPNSVVGGQVGGVELPVCVGRGDDGRYHPGKYYADKCNIAYGGQVGNNYGREVRVEPGYNGSVLILVQN